MAFVSECPRAQIYTNDVPIGPGHYSPVQSSQQDKRSHYAPFLSTTQRHLEKASAKSSLPAPGTYDLNCKIEPQVMVLEEQSGTKVFNLTKPHSFFSSKVDRFKHSSALVPGPGFYASNSDKANINQVKMLIRDRPSRPKQLLAGIFQKGYEKIPSIPNNELKYGYVETKDKKLTPIARQNQKIIPPDSTVETQYKYSPTKIIQNEKEQRDTLSKLRNLIQKQTQFQTGQSLERSCSSKERKQKEQKQPYKDSAKTSSYLKNIPNRFDEVIEQSPGPGSYTIEPPKRRTHRQKFQFFGSSSLRFSLDEKGEPQKLSPTLLLNRQVRRSQRENWSKEKRELFSSISSTLPGPGAYDNVVPNQIRKTVNVVVGKEERFKPLVQQDPQPPQSYDFGLKLQSQSPSPKPKSFIDYKKRHPLFNRLKQSSVTTANTPNISIIIGSPTEPKPQVKKSASPNGLPVQKPKVGFGYLQERFNYEQQQSEKPSTPKENLVMEVSKKNVNFNKTSAGNFRKRLKQGCFGSQSQRFNSFFNQEVQQLPGPGAYGSQNVSPLVRTSFNIKFR